jgi:hypothetical protein
VSGVEPKATQIIVNLGGQRPNVRFASLEALYTWRAGAGASLIVRMLTFTGVGRYTGVRRDFEDGETVGSLYDHNGVLGFSASGPQSIALLTVALTWYNEGCYEAP